MLRLAVAVLVIALAGAANADGWRSLRIDGSSTATFGNSVSELRSKLSPERREVFDLALDDIRHSYPETEYRQRLDGLGYNEVVNLLDPTGATAERRYKTATRKGSVSARAPAAVPSPAIARRPWPEALGGEQIRGSPDAVPPRP